MPYEPIFLSKLYNSPQVSNVEAMCAARHNSVAAGVTYIQRNAESEAGRFRALSNNMIPQSLERSVGNNFLLKNARYVIQNPPNITQNIENEGKCVGWYKKDTYGG